jgi:hypothetical protein
VSAVRESPAPELQRPSWSVAIMTSREEIGTLSQTIDAAMAAVRGRNCVVDVVVNGNRELAERAAAKVRSVTDLAPGTTVRVWHLELGDKAHCINECIHRIWPESDIAFFIDGYARVAPNAMTAIAEALGRAPEALAASGVPSVGRSASALRHTLLTAGGMTGALFAVRGATIERMRQRGFRLPRGMYRTDGTMAAAFYFNLDPAAHEWDLKRIVVCPDATFEIRTKSVFRPKDVKEQFDRKVRLAWGAFITRAVRTHLAVRKRSPEELAPTAVELVLGWVKEFPVQALLLAARRPLVALALARALRGRNRSDHAVPPQLLVRVAA